ncbi:MAG: membrane protein insertase YidC, partial [Rhizobacter sp.]
MRRTLLWVVFSMSLFLIWDAWNKHEGRPSFFSPAPATKPAAVGTPPVAGGIPTPTTSVAGAAPGVAAPAAAASAPTVAAEQVTISTDLVKATLDSKGGDLIRVELLKQVDKIDPTKNTVLLDQSAERLYVAQSGLIPAAGGAGLPNHHTVMTLVPGERTLQPGQNAVQVKFESPVVGGVKLVKTYTFKRNDYVIDVKNEVVNESGAPVNPRLYLQLVRDGNSPAGESSFYFTFTGPAIYDEAAKFHKVEFKAIEKRGPADKPDHPTAADNGWVAMVQHYFASAWLLPDKLPR